MPKLSPLWVLLLGQTVLRAMFFIPTILAYVALKGVDVASFLVLQGIFQIAVLLWELPTGHLADRWQRHHQLRLAAVAWLACLLLLYRADSFLWLVASEVLAALSAALLSGTAQAYVHELLREQGREDEQVTWQGRLEAAPPLGETLACFSGGWMYATWGPESPMIASLLATMVGLMFAFMLPDVPRDPGEPRHANWAKNIWLVVHHHVREHPHLRHVFFGPFVMFGFTGVVFWFTQTKLTAMAPSEAWLGLAIGVYQGVRAVMSLNADRLLKWLGAPGLTAMLLAMMVTGALLVLTSSLYLILAGGMIGAAAVYAVGKPVATTLVNQQVGDHERATVNSFGSFVSKTVAAILLLLAKPLMEVMTIETITCLYLAVTLLLAGYSLVRLMRRNT